MKIKIIIPVYNPDKEFSYLLKSIASQSIKNLAVLIIDSGTNHKYRESIQSMKNITVMDIDAQDFNHGGTRQMGIDICNDVDVFVFLTQDAILADEYAIEELTSVFENESIGCAYGKQIPHKNAEIYAKLAREFNYGDKSYIRSVSEKDKYGIKTAFISNSFAAYRNIAMLDVGGFPTKTILSEDMYVAAKMLLQGWKVAYQAEAKVYHSHNYTVIQEFKRYFDIGVFHARERWIQNQFGNAEGTGIKFVKYEINKLKYYPLRLIEMIVRDSMKLLGYKLGIREKYLPKAIKGKISMNKKFWENEY